MPLPPNRAFLFLGPQGPFARPDRPTGRLGLTGGLTEVQRPTEGQRMHARQSRHPWQHLPQALPLSAVGSAALGYFFCSVGVVTGWALGPAGRSSKSAGSRGSLRQAAAGSRSRNVGVVLGWCCMVSHPFMAGGRCQLIRGRVVCPV